MKGELSQGRDKILNSNIILKDYLKNITTTTKNLRQLLICPVLNFYFTKGEGIYDTSVPSRFFWIHSIYEMEIYILTLYFANTSITLCG